MKEAFRIDPVSSLRTFLNNLPERLLASPVLLACSGGPDSMALLYAAAKVARQHPFSFAVAHVNHKLRGKQSDQDAKYVEIQSEKLGVNFYSAVARIAQRKSGNLEENARDARYTALEVIAKTIGSRLVLTAHTADDQAETVFMNFLRGSGSDGLAGIPPMRRLSATVQVGRPFLAVPRPELHRWIKGLDCRPRIDRTNADERFVRNWVRRRVLPQMEQRFPGLKERLTNMATLFQDERAFWASFLVPVEASVLRSERGGRLLDLGGLLSYSAAVQRRFLRRMFGENLLTFDAVERLRYWMMSPPTGGRTFQLRQGWTVTRLSKSQGAPSAKLFLIKEENHK